MHHFIIRFTLDGPHVAKCVLCLDQFVSNISAFELAEQNQYWAVDLFSADTPKQDWINQLCNLLDQQAIKYRLNIYKQTPKDWLAGTLEGFEKIRIGGFNIIPSADQNTIYHHGLKTNRWNILLPPGMAFGTGHHMTTRHCLKAIEWCAKKHPYSPILQDQTTLSKHKLEIGDIGCGTGILAIACANIWPHANIYASDVDVHAIHIAQDNINHNRLAHRIKCFNAYALTHHRWQRSNKFNLLISNILMKPILRLIPQIAKRLDNKGRWIASGLLDKQAKAVISRSTKHKLHLLHQYKNDGWATLIFERLT
ncbi:MAG: 50S ribosomal protein L11 methyltransferase [Pseudomonadota bacterium]